MRWALASMTSTSCPAAAKVVATFDPKFPKPMTTYSAILTSVQPTSTSPGAY